MSTRRRFIAQVGAGAAASLLDVEELEAGTRAATQGEWDTAWIARLTPAQFRVVFNVSDISDGAVLSYASAFLDHFHEVHATSDAQTQPVAVFRRLGTPIAFNDEMWDRYSIGADRKLMDPVTRAPARRNVFWKAPAGASSDAGTGPKLETLHARGMISLVCNIALENWGRSLAEQVKRDAGDVIRDLKANLVPGATLVPSGIYALIRAQNAGCAYMPGT
jgi:intracellular sulfur oxidation DsrE/DsrF family protein